MIYVFHGDDTFSAHEALAQLVAGVGSVEVIEPNVSRFDAGDFDLAKFTAAAMVMPFLGERRLVVIRGLMGAAESARAGRRGRRGKAQTADQGPAAGLPDALRSLPPTTDVAFVEERLPKTNQLLSELQDLGPELVRAREFPALRRDALNAWITRRAEQKGANLTRDAVALLAESIGGNLWALDNELEKLATFRSHDAIDADDVRSLVATAQESNIFQLVDAIMERRTDAAMQRLEQLLQNGVTGPSMMALIARQARLIALAQSLARQRVPQAQWGSHLGIQHEFVLRKTAEQARRFTPDAVRELYRLLLDADLAMKTGEVPDELALVEFVARACALRTAARAGGQ